jgi:hypothetical protein
VEVFALELPKLERYFLALSKLGLIDSLIILTKTTAENEKLDVRVVKDKVYVVTHFKLIPCVPVENSLNASSCQISRLSCVGLPTVRKHYKEQRCRGPVPRGGLFTL